jgi:nucleoside-diphosphate-sugar epimerase
MDVRLAWWPDHRIAVTGATGFIGQAVMAVLGREGMHAISIDDVPEDAALIHLAASIGGSDVIGENFAIDRFVVEQASKKLAALIYASTNNIYNLGYDKRVQDLDVISQPYGLSKRIGEALVQASFPRSWAVLRIGDVFGCGQRHSNLFRAIQESVATRSALTILGQGAKVRNYIYASELGLLLVHFARELRSGEKIQTVSNVCYPTPISVAELVESIASKAALPIQRVEVDPDASAGDVRTMISGPFLGYRFVWTFDEALTRYVQCCLSSKLPQ